MLWIGLTGGIGTGKTTVSDALRELGYPVVDADLLVREILSSDSEALDELRQVFGPGIFADDRTVDRARLAELVFSDPKKLQRLESIIHPRVQKRVQECRNRLREESTEVAFYDVPLLFEKELGEQFDKTVVVYCPRTAQIERILKRDNWSLVEIERRLQAQWDIEKKKQMADFVIDNSGDENQLSEKVSEVVELIKKSRN